MPYPPRTAKLLLQILSSPEREDAYFRDIEEIFRDKVNRFGLKKAKRWYWREVIRAMPRFVQESVRWRFAMINNYLKIAFRNIVRHRGYSLINILGLAVGLACCMLMLLWVFDELSHDRFHDNLDQLYQVAVSTERGLSDSSPWALIPALKQDYPEIIKGSHFFQGTFPMKAEDRLYNENCALVMPEFLEMFTFPFIKGNAENAFRDRNSIVLTEKTAAKYFRDEDPIGKTIQFNNQVDLQVTGVLRDIPANSSFQFDLLTHPAHYMGEERLLTWSMDCPGYVMLAANADPEVVNQKIANTINEHDARTNNPYYIEIRPVKRMHLYALQGTNPVVYVYLFSIIAAIVLLIACINFMNLATARSLKRAREVGMRKVVGASRSEIIRQFFGESVLISCIAVVLSMVLAKLMLPVFNSLSQKELALDFMRSPLLAALFVAILLATGILSGSYPALYLSSFQPIVLMRNTSGRSSRSPMLRKILIVFQFTAAVVLIISTIMIYRQMDFIQSRDLGFDREQILAISMNRPVRNRYPAIKERLLQHRDISHVTAASSIPLAIGNNNPVYWEGKGPESYEMINFVCCDFDYFETFDMTMSHGRSFSREFPTDGGNYIINETALKMTGYEDPIGRMFSMWTQEGEIVGVVKDFHGTSLHNQIRPIVFVLYKNLPYFNMFVKINPVQASSTIDYIGATVKEAVPDFVFAYSFLDSYFEQQYWREERFKKLLKYFTVLSVFISCLGMLGLISYMAEQRTREVAIRKVLGARSTTIVGVLSKEFVFLVGLANLIAWPLAFYFTHQWMQYYAYHTDIGWWVFVVSGAAALVITLLTVSFQSIKAALANPIDSLRYE
jgi:ABC-type antimicrobial peptide transport system permease subunit